MVVGAALVLALDVPALLPVVVLLGCVVGARREPRSSAWGVATGAGLPLLWVAYHNRHGPGTVCWTRGGAGGCDQYLNPWPWLGVGLLLVVIGVVAQARRRRASRSTPAA
jgi:hypothetical protein